MQEKHDTATKFTLKKNLNKQENMFFKILSMNNPIPDTTKQIIQTL